MKGFLIKILMMGCVAEFFKSESGRGVQDEVAQMFGILNDPKVVEALLKQSSQHGESFEMAAKQFKDVKYISAEDAIKEITGKN